MIEPSQAQPGDALVQCVALSKVFRDFWMRQRVRAVQDLDLDLRRGEVLGLLGPNGSGKSTTIKMILGLLKPSSGHVLVFGKRPEDVQVKRRIGFLPEESYLYPFLNARETLDYFGRLYRQSGDIRRDRTDELLKMVRLEGASRRPVGEFSKGMQRRIGLAQALINDPELLILDEPTSGMDPEGAQDVKQLIKLLAQRGKTVLLSSHLLADVEDVCTRVVMMYGGRIQRQGTLDELLVRHDRTTVELPEARPEMIEQLRAWLAERGLAASRFEHPRQRLETVFLDMIEQAKAAGLPTSGAYGGGEVASFLREADQEAAPEKLIESLVTEQPRAPEPGPAEPTPTLSQEPAVLDQLTEPEQPEASRKAPTETQPQKPARPEPDHGVLDEMLRDDQPGDRPDAK